MEKEINRYSLTGKWNWKNTSVRYEGEWQILETFEASDHIWHFRENNIMESEYFEKTCYRVVYKWDEPGMILSLNGHKLDRDGEKYALVYETYNVVFLNPDELYLYDTEDFMSMQGSRIRLYFKRSNDRKIK